MSKRRTAGLAGVLLVGGIAGLLWATRERSRNRLTVVNHSGQLIALCRVTTGGETIAFRGVPDGAEVAAPFRIRSDDHFAVGGRFADGTGFGGNFGYVTNGMGGERASFVVRHGGTITFEQSNGASPD